jgi:hypothetical protein
MKLLVITNADSNIIELLIMPLCSAIITGKYITMANQMFKDFKQLLTESSEVLYNITINFGMKESA